MPPATIEKPGDIPPGSTESHPSPTTDPGSAQNLYDLNQDPGYLRAQSSAYAAKGAAASDYLASVEQSLLGFGSQQLAQQLLGSMTPELEKYMRDAGTLGANAHLDLSPFYQSFYLHDAHGNQLTDASGNPLQINDPSQGFSTLAQVGRAAQQSTRDAINANRLGNLAYGAAGATNLANTGYGNQLALNNATATENAALGQFLSGYHGAIQTARDNLNTAASAAYDRLLQLALKNGTGASSSGGASSGASGGSSSGGSSSGGGGASTPPPGQVPAPTGVGGVIPGSRTVPQNVIDTIVPKAIANGEPVSEHGAGQMTPTAMVAPTLPSVTAAVEQHAPAVAAASQAAHQQAIAQGASPAEAALAARSAGLNAAFGLGGVTTSNPALTKKTAAQKKSLNMAMFLR